MRNGVARFSLGVQCCRHKIKNLDDNTLDVISINKKIGTTLKTSLKDNNLVTDNCLTLSYHTTGVVPIDSSKSFTFCHININGLWSKIDELAVITNNNKFDVICISETHLNESQTSMMKLPGYNGFHYCRKFKSRGGSSTYVKNGLTVTKEGFDLYDLQTEEFFEFVAIDIRIKKKCYIYCCKHL